MNIRQPIKWAALIVIFGSFLLLPMRLADACGSVPEQRAYSFLEPTMVDTASIYAPFALSFDQFEFPFLKVDQQVSNNIKEWAGKYCSNPSYEDTYQVIYKTPIQDLEEWRAATTNPNLPLPLDLRNNTFAEVNQVSGCTEVADYLIFAKECEPFVIAPKNAWIKENKNIGAIHDLMKKGGKLFKNTESPFIRLRIAYQVIRLAHYIKEYKKVIKLHDYFLPKVDKKVNSIIRWWILGHVAGAELRLGKKALAAYHFAQVFQNSPSKRTSAFRSFHIDNDNQWGQAILRCQSNDEKANLYAIRASHTRSRIVPELEAIYRLNSKHSSLEPLLVRATKQLEKIFLGAEFKHKKPTKQQKKQLKNFQKFVQKAIDEDKINHPILWNITHGYLLILAGNWPEAQLVFSNLETQEGNLQNQIALFKTITKINSFQNANTQTESELYNIMTLNETYKKTPLLRRFLKDRLAYLYSLDTLPGKSLLINHRLEDLKYNPDIATLDNLIKVTEKENPTRLEQALTQKKDGTSIRNELLEIKATLLLSQGQVEAANETYSLIPRSNRSPKMFYPFVEDFRDCVHCPATDTTAYTKAGLIEKLVEYDYRARADIKKGPEYFYLLGNAWYNMSYFGPAWEVADYFRSGSSWHFSYDDVYSCSQSPFGNKENHNLSKAKLYLSKTLELSKDPELQARAAFLLARIDQKEYFLSEKCTYRLSKNNIPKLPPSRMIYYNLLVKEYQDTEFYEQIIEECAFFQAYAR